MSVVWRFVIERARSGIQHDLLPRRSFAMHVGIHRGSSIRMDSLLFMALAWLSYVSRVSLASHPNGIPRTGYPERGTC